MCFPVFDYDLGTVNALATISSFRLLVESIWVEQNDRVRILKIQKNSSRQKTPIELEEKKSGEKKTAPNKSKIRTTDWHQSSYRQSREHGCAFMASARLTVSSFI